jgi:hypothetical protein
MMFAMMNVRMYQSVCCCYARGKFVDVRAMSHVIRRGNAERWSSGTLTVGTKVVELTEVQAWVETRLQVSPL